MPIERRDGTCTTCDGPIYRYPHPDPAQPDRWAHRRTMDWYNNPHEAEPAPDDDG